MIWLFDKFLLPFGSNLNSVVIVRHHLFNVLLLAIFLENRVNPETIFGKFSSKTQYCHIFGGTVPDAKSTPS